MSEEWRSFHMRQKVVNEFDAIIKQNPATVNRSGAELEATLFNKATKKEDYVGNVSKLIVYLKDRAPQSSGQANSNLTSMLTGQATNSSLANSNINHGMAGNQMPMSSSVSQTQPTNANQPQMVHSAAGGGPLMAHGNTSGGQVIHSGVAGATAGVVGGNIMGPGQIRTSQSMGNPIGNQSEMVNWQGGQPKGRRNQEMVRLGMNKQHPGMIGMQQLNLQGKIPPMVMSSDPNINPMVVSPHVQQRGMQPRVPSPVYSVSGAGGGPSPNPRQPNSNQPVHSPSMQQSQHGMSFITPSPSNPSPSPGSGRNNMGQMNVQSPQGMIHTPLSQNAQQQQPSPLQPSMNPEDRALNEKLRHLQAKYLNTLRTVAKKVGNNESEQSRKIRNLLDILENPQKRLPTMDLLNKLEPFLEKIDSQPREARGETDAAQAKSQTKENPVSILFDAVSFALKSPKGLNTIHRTLAPALNTLMGPELDSATSLKRKRVSPSPPLSSQDLPAISDIIQGEVARLPSRFKVNLECPQGPGRDDITLNCQLDDPCLPCVPLITITLPPNYPSCPPQTVVLHYDYNSTSFLQRVKKIMMERQLYLPEVSSLTMILDMWEMSVRQACSSDGVSLPTLATMISAP